MSEVASQVYTWEPSNAAIAARYGLRPEDILRFDTNTSPLPPPFVGEALAEAFEPTLNEYPDSSYEELTAAAAVYTGVAPDQVIVGAGRSAERRVGQAARAGWGTSWEW